ncbi:hypothetical protein FM112_14725 [Gulosibacter sp. 10]|nr:hypothetical protein FM112_14725 [Gulosibacter sp. 10]
MVPERCFSDRYPRVAGLLKLLKGDLTSKHESIELVKKRVLR